MDRAYTAWLSQEEPGNDRGGGEWVFAWEACLDYARGATVAEIVEWLPNAPLFVVETQSQLRRSLADVIEARFSPAPPEREDRCTCYRGSSRWDKACPIHGAEHPEGDKP